MKKTNLLLASSMATVFLFSGCAQNGLSVSSIGKPEVAQRFETGTVVSSEKVLIDKTLTATLGGAGIGAATGAVSGGDAKDAIVGAGVGAIVGAVASKITGAGEVVAFETKIKDRAGNIKVAYLKKQLQAGTIVEFVDRDNKITNVDVLRMPSVTATSTSKSTADVRVQTTFTSSLSKRRAVLESKNSSKPQTTKPKSHKVKNESKSVEKKTEAKQQPVKVVNQQVSDNEAGEEDIW